MTKRLTKLEVNLLGVLLIVGAIALASQRILEVTGYVFPLVSIAAIIGAFGWHSRNKKRRRLEYLRSKYPDETIVQRILQRGFWEGQTSDQLADSLGTPANVDKKMMK